MHWYYPFRYIINTNNVVLFTELDRGSHLTYLRAYVSVSG